MGLDGIELLMRVEEAFGIEIPDEEASRIATVGQMYEAVVDKLKQMRSRDCQSAKAFYRLRRALVTVTDFDRSAIRPDTPLETLLPRRGRRRRWKRLAGVLGLSLRPLRRPELVVWTIVLVVLALPIIGWLAIRSISGPTAAVLSGSAVFLGVFGALLTRPLATGMRECRTVGDLAKAVLGDNFAAFTAQANVVNEKEVWGALLSLIADELGLREDDLDRDTRFVDDLNVG